jgi:hypothetical protein
MEEAVGAQFSLTSHAHISMVPTGARQGWSSTREPWKGYTILARQAYCLTRRGKEGSNAAIIVEIFLHLVSLRYLCSTVLPHLRSFATNATPQIHSATLLRSVKTSEEALLADWVSQPAQPGLPLITWDFDMGTKVIQSILNRIAVSTHDVGIKATGRPTKGQLGVSKCFELLDSTGVLPAE